MLLNIFVPDAWMPWLVGLGLLVLAGLIGFGLLAWGVDVLQRRAAQAQEERTRAWAQHMDELRKGEEFRWIEEQQAPLATTRYYTFQPEWEYEQDRARMAWLGYDVVSIANEESDALVVHYTHSGLRAQPWERAGV